ncbi:hypothetical protein BH09PAT2_BH09PAT2_01880 [soil metagenome]
MNILNRLQITIFTIAFMIVMSLSLLPSLTLNTVSAASDPACETERTNSGIPACQSVNANALGFKIPSLGDLLTFAIRGFFAIAGIAALFYMLIGAFGWVTSGGDKDSIGAARDRIQAALVGMILIVAVLALIWTLEQVIFKKRICLGLSCPVTLPGLIETGDGQRYCCSCLTEEGTEGSAIDAYTMYCRPNSTNFNGTGEFNVIP